MRSTALMTFLTASLMIAAMGIAPCALCCGSVEIATANSSVMNVFLAFIGFCLCFLTGPDIAGQFRNGPSPVTLPSVGVLLDLDLLRFLGRIGQVFFEGDFRRVHL